VAFELDDGAEDGEEEDDEEFHVMSSAVGAVLWLRSRGLRRCGAGEWRGSEDAMVERR
jgi:hypothetical protein